MALAVQSQSAGVATHTQTYGETSSNCSFYFYDDISCKWVIFSPTNQYLTRAMVSLYNEIMTFLSTLDNLVPCQLF